MPTTTRCRLPANDRYPKQYETLRTIWYFCAFAVCVQVSPPWTELALRSCLGDFHPTQVMEAPSKAHIEFD